VSQSYRKRDKWAKQKAFPGGPSERPISSSQQAVGQQENRNRPLSRGLSKATRVSAPSTSVPASPSVASNNMLDLLQRRREEQHFRELSLDPYQQYIFSNQGHPQQPYQHTPHSFVPGSVMQGVQPQPPLSAHVQSPPMNTDPSHRAPERNFQPPQLRISHAPSAQTSSTGVTSDILSYMTPPEDRKRPLPTNSSQPQNQDHFIPQHPSANGTPRNITQSVPANSNPASRHSSTTNSAPAAYARRYSNQPPGYSAIETGNNVQGNVTAPK
jgi:hypothetical protein